MDQARVPLAGSERGQVPRERVVGPTEDEQVHATLILRRRAALPTEQTPISRDELAEKYGADPQDVSAVESTVTSAGGQVVSVDPGSRRVRIAGTPQVMETLFGASLVSARVSDADDAPVVRHQEGELSLPANLDGVVTAVLGLDQRDQAEARFRIASNAAASSSYTPPQLAEIYQMPQDADGTGQTVAIIELGGGYRQSDLDTYFTKIGVKTPTVTAVGVDGADNTPTGDPKGPDGEVLLDIDVVGGIAPGASMVVYFAPNTDAGFVDAVSTAAHASPTPVAMSISWGQSEEQWSEQARTSMDDAFADAVALGVTVTAAAGDSGSSDTAGGGSTSHVDFPASSPHVLGCGGTSLKADGSNGQVSSETVWNSGSGGGATGGGVSRVYPVPDWQASAGVPAPVAAEGSGRHARASGGRGVPDVAGDADPATGYQVYVDGTATVYGGTSAVAPLWAALFARLAQKAGKPFGLVQPALYASASAGASPQGFRDITEGDNGAFKAGAGWDACTGLGVPVGTDLLQVLQGSPDAKN